MLLLRVVVPAGGFFFRQRRFANCLNDWRGDLCGNHFTIPGIAPKHQHLLFPGHFNKNHHVCFLNLQIETISAGIRNRNTHTHIHHTHTHTHTPHTHTLNIRMRANDLNSKPRKMSRSNKRCAINRRGPMTIQIENMRQTVHLAPAGGFVTHKKQNPRATTSNRTRDDAVKY